MPKVPHPFAQPGLHQGFLLRPQRDSRLAIDEFGKFLKCFVVQDNGIIHEWLFHFSFTIEGLRVYIDDMFETPRQRKEPTPRQPVLRLDDCEVLSEISIDAYRFKITLTPLFHDGCVLWFMDARVDEAFEALGRFSRFDRKHVLEFHCSLHDQGGT